MKHKEIDKRGITNLQNDSQMVSILSKPLPWTGDCPGPRPFRCLGLWPIKVLGPWPRQISRREPKQKSELFICFQSILFVVRQSGADCLKTNKGQLVCVQAFLFCCGPPGRVHKSKKGPSCFCVRLAYLFSTPTTLPLFPGWSWYVPRPFCRFGVVVQSWC